MTPGGASNWPTMAEYQEAVQTPSASFADASLKAGTPVLNKLGLPRPICGQFASVYEFTSAGTRWAIKCFLRNIPDLHGRYAKIAAHLATCSHLPYFMTFEYLDNGIKVRGSFHPIVKMEWIEGLQLNTFIQRNVSNRAVIEALELVWLQLLEDLRSVNVAHGDLQHGNVLVADDGKLRLIDYDGMWVPKLKGAGSHETGHPDYQSPQRTGNDFHEGTDEFAGRVILVALRALQRRPELWEKYNNDDNLLFRRQDFADPKSSALFAELRAMGEPSIRDVLDELAAGCSAASKRGMFARLLRPSRPAAPAGGAGGGPAKHVPVSAAPAAPAPAQPARVVPPGPRPAVHPGPQRAVPQRPVSRPAAAPPPPRPAPSRPAAPPPPRPAPRIAVPQPAPRPAPRAAAPPPPPPPPKPVGKAGWLTDHVGGAASHAHVHPARPTKHAPPPRVLHDAPLAPRGAELSPGRRILAWTRLALHIMLLAPLVTVAALQLQDVLAEDADQAKAILTAGFGVAVVIGIVSLTTLYVVRAAHGMASTLFFGVASVIMLLNVFSAILTFTWAGWTEKEPFQCALMLTMLGTGVLGLVIEFGCRRLNVVAIWRAPWNG